MVNFINFHLVFQVSFSFEFNSKSPNSKSNLMAALLKEYRLVIVGEGG